MRFRHHNVRDDAFLDAVADARTREVVASKCFCLSDDAARDAIASSSGGDALDTLHVGDVFWAALRAPRALATHGLRVLGLTNGTVDATLLAAVLAGDGAALPRLAVLFLGGCVGHGDGAVGAAPARGPEPRPAASRRARRAKRTCRR